MFEAVPGVEAGGVWDERRCRVFDLAHCAAMINADGSPEQVDLSADWLSWGTYGDDYFPQVFGLSHDVAGAKVCSDRLSLFMPLDDPDDLDDPTSTPEPTNALERGLLDVWQRTAGPMASRGRSQLRAAVEKMTAAWVWEVANQSVNRVPDPVDYIEMRRQTFGSDMTASLARFEHDDVVPPELYQTRVMRELETAAFDYAGFLNDLFSYQKEIEFEGEAHNLVAVVENFLNVDRLAARDVVADLMTERMRQFEHLVAEGLPALCQELDLDQPVRTALTRYADGYKDWMSGILEWHRRCARYTEAELLRHHRPPAPSFSFLPTGLGTSAARFPAMVAAGTAPPSHPG
jgi:germacradienol/geosmin synthase